MIQAAKPAAPMRTTMIAPAHEPPLLGPAVGEAMPPPEPPDPNDGIFTPPSFMSGSLRFFSMPRFFSAQRPKASPSVLNSGNQEDPLPEAPPSLNFVAKSLIMSLTAGESPK